MWAHQNSAGGRRTCNSRGTFRESQRPHRHSGYAATMSHIVDSESSCCEEASSQQIWRDAMMEEHQSIMKNDVWDIVPRP
jgi:hypothetical protein